MESLERINLLEVMLKECIDIIIKSVGENPYQDLEKALKIIQDKNVKQYASLKDKIGNTIIAIYNTRFINMEIVLYKLDESYRLVEKLSCSA